MLESSAGTPLGGRRCLKERLVTVCSLATLRTCFPILTWLPRYSLAWLKMDLLAGLTVGLTVVPQALAYAEVAGLPVQYGLYSSFMGGFLYCVFGTSKDITLGPTSIMSLLCSFYVGGDPVYAVVLTLMCGLTQTAMALLRLGFLLDFISYPVVKGFTCAAAVTIGFGQFKNVLAEPLVGDVILGLFCLLFLVMITVMKNTLGSSEVTPSPLVRFARSLVWSFATVRNALVVIAAACVAYSAEVMGCHLFTLTGQTAEGLPAFSPPALSETTANGTHMSFSDIILDLGGGLAVIPLMGVLESIAIAKAFGSQNNYRIDANQEIFVIGLTNVLGSFVSAYPVTGSFGRTAVNSQTGACTPAGGIVTSVVVLLSLAFLMPLFAYIPKASLAAVIICAVAPMMDFRVLPQIWRVKKLDLLPFLVTFLVSFWEVQYGIMGGVVVSVLMLNISVLCKYLLSTPRCVVLDCHHVSSIDYTVVNELKDLLKQFKLHDVSLVFSRLKPCVLEVLLSSDLPGFRHGDSIEACLQIMSINAHYD
uniref:STAS domain-containing protein n=1 Tax=Electrophorus electricus TaxID=8005 RepID=A0A4W4FQU0_ELEEL